MIRAASEGGNTSKAADGTGWSNGKQNANAKKTEETIPTLSKPQLCFSPYAWAKLRFMRDKGPTEVGFFGISSPDAPLNIIDVMTVKQKCTAAHVEFDDVAVTDFLTDQVDAGRKMHQVGRVWIHTHPDNSATPSSVDEATFTRVFGKCNFSVMAIVARGGEKYARLRYNVGLRTEHEIPVVVDYNLDFPAKDEAAWLAEYNANVSEEVYTYNYNSHSGAGAFGGHYYERYGDHDFWPERVHTPAGPVSAPSVVAGDGRWAQHLKDWRASIKSKPVTGFKATTREDSIPIVLDSERPTETSSDNGPSDKRPLWEELEGLNLDEQIQLLKELDITMDEIEDYEVYTDKDGNLVAQLEPDLLALNQAQAQSESDAKVFEELVMTGFITKGE